jgi:nitrogen fixation NifU-like protein
MTTMNRGERVAWLVDHAKRLAHLPTPTEADIRLAGGNPGCGDVVTVHLKADASGDRVAAVGFGGTGCTLSRAAASILAEHINGSHPTLADVERFSDAEMMDLVGRDVADARPRCATLALSTLKTAIKVLAMDRKLTAAGHSAEEIAALRKAIADAAATGHMQVPH